MSDMGQIGLFEVEYPGPMISDVEPVGPGCSTSKNAVTSRFRSLKVIEHDSF